MSQVCGRFAPSPSGRMHLGNLWSCLLAWLSARSAGGRILLRLEDLDPDRCRPQYSTQIMRDLQWLGLDWDGDPVYQSTRSHIYAEQFERLKSYGLIYPCYCTRSERHAAGAPHPGDGVEVYSGRCRHLTQSELDRLSAQRRPAWRVSVPQEEFSFVDLCQGFFAQQLATQCGDFILRRSDGVYAYQLAVVIDDALMGVTQVVRGRDLLDSTPRQLWLYRQLGFPAPEYAHVPMLLAGDGRRLAKRDMDLELGQLQTRYRAPELVGILAYLAGLIPSPEPVTPTQLIPLFSWAHVPKSDIVISRFVNF